MMSIVAPATRPVQALKSVWMPNASVLLNCLFVPKNVSISKAIQSTVEIAEKLVVNKSIVTRENALISRVKNKIPRWLPVGMRVFLSRIIQCIVEIAISHVVEINIVYQEVADV